MRSTLTRPWRFVPVALLVGCHSVAPLAMPDATDTLEQMTRNTQPRPFDVAKVATSEEPAESVASKTRTVAHSEDAPKPLGFATDLLPVPPMPDGSPKVAGRQLGLSEITSLTLARHPRLAQLDWAVEAARGRAVQAGLYPNPTFSITGDELGDKTGPAGIWNVPQLSQEIVLGGKLELSRAAALKEVDQASLAIITERFRLLTEVRQNYWEVVTLRRRAEVLKELIGLADKSVDNADRLFKIAKLGSELDVVQLEVERERYQAELDATNKALPAAFRRLAASTGVYDLPEATIVGDLETALTDYDLQRVKAYVLGIHPDIRAAQIGVEKVQLVIRRAEAEPIPNITLSTGYTRQSQNRSNDWLIGVSLPLPTWNRNQGNIFAARAQLGEALNEASRVQNELAGKVATAFASYADARAKAERYQKHLIPKAEKSLALSQKAYQGGQFEYLRVLQAQRAIAEARLEYIRALGDMWRNGSSLAGLMLEDQWPAPPQAPEKK